MSWPVWLGWSHAEHCCVRTGPYHPTPLLSCGAHLQDQLLAQLALMREDIARLRMLASFAVPNGTGDGTSS